MTLRLYLLRSCLPALLALWLAACRPPAESVVRLSVVGDVLLARGVPAGLARDSARLRRTARELWTGSRYVLGNLECPLTDVAQPAAKRIVFRGEPGYARYLRTLGFTHLSLANNHSLDQHAAGLRATADHLRAAGLRGVGYEADSAAGCLPTLLDSTAAIFAYSAFREQLPGEACVCGRRFRDLCERVAAFRTLFPRRAVIVYLHWGTEYAAAPGAAQRAQARRLIDCGAAAVVGAHPHVVQSVEFYRGRPIVYSIGNFLFDQAGRATDLAVQVDFDLRAGWVEATHLRPLQLVNAVPRPAEAAARERLLARLHRSGPTHELRDSDGAGWLLVPRAADAGPPADGYFTHELQLGGEKPAAVRVGYLPGRRAYRVHVRTPADTGSGWLGFPIYQLTQGDADRDGRADLLVGAVKATHFDSVVRRRLFVYRLDGARLQPRWLGSRLTYRLLYFAPRADSAGLTYIQTIEQEPTGTYCIGRYAWQGFGLAPRDFPTRHLTLEQAYRRFFR